MALHHAAQHEMRRGDRRLHRVADEVPQVVVVEAGPLEPRVVGWTKTSAPVASAAAQNGASRSSPSATPFTRAAISTPANKPTAMSASSSPAAISGSCSGTVPRTLTRSGCAARRAARPAFWTRQRSSASPCRRVVAEQVHPRAQHDVVDPGLVLRGEDRVGGDEVARRPSGSPARPARRSARRPRTAPAAARPRPARRRAGPPGRSRGRGRRPSCRDDQEQGAGDDERRARPHPAGDALGGAARDERRGEQDHRDRRAGSAPARPRPSCGRAPPTGPTSTARRARPPTSLSASAERPAVRSPSPRRETANARR